jgi:hypothetical protein
MEKNELSAIPFHRRANFFAGMFSKDRATPLANGGVPRTGPHARMAHHGPWPFRQAPTQVR